MTLNVEQIEAWRKTWREKYEDTRIVECREAFFQLNALCDLAISALSHRATEQGWIPVSERLPEKGEQVALRMDNPLGGDAYRTGMLVGKNEPMWHIPNHEHEVTGKPTHWMPLLIGGASFAAYVDLLGRVEKVREQALEEAALMLENSDPTVAARSHYAHLVRKLK